MDATNIIPVNIEDEMRGSYLDYAMSVIVGRALPDIRDGLKPVHRRILYAMLREGLTSNKKFSKCAGVVGEVLKHYHPHGDSAVYDALVRMAQSWNLRYPLIDGQGNFGSIDGDSAAAYRYTECRMTSVAEAMLYDIDKETVDYEPNFDESTVEPIVLPSRVPGLLVNGASGIAVGMASVIPPHNLNEVIKACVSLVENPEISTDELMEIIPAPDFPTGGIIYGADPIREIYETGRGVLRLRAQVRMETLKVRSKEVEAIIVDEIPYQVNKSTLIEKIAELVNSKKIEGVSRLRDESDRSGMRIVIELKRDVPSEIVLNQLFKLTYLQRSFGVTMLAIVDGRPQILALKEILEHFVEFRRTVVTRRAAFELKKALARLHILEGLLIALQHIDEVVELIKASESTPEARVQLQQRFSLSEIQAQQILDMPLKRLTGLERRAIEEEHAEVTATIERLEKLLSDPAEVDKIVVEELREVDEKYSDSRRTVIEHNVEDIDVEDLIIEEEMIVSISHRGYIKRTSPSLFRAQRRGGKGVRGTKKLSEEDEDFVSEMFLASTHAYLLIFTSTGKVYWQKVHQLPLMGRTARGRAIVNMLSLKEDEKVSAVLPVRNFAEGRLVVVATRKGYIKRVDLMAFSNVRKSGIRAISLDIVDEVIGVAMTDGERDCIISTKSGMAIRFDENQVRMMGRTARGVRAVSLGNNDEVVSLSTTSVPESTEEEDDTVDTKDEPAILTVCEGGYGKRTSISRYRTQGRGGKGVIDIKTTDRNGPVVGVLQVEEKDQVMVITTAGKVIRMPVKGISRIGRNTKGVRLIDVDEDEQVAAVARIADASEDENGANGVAASEEEAPE